MGAHLRERLEVFGYRSYTLYFSGTVVSAIGNGMQFIATSWLALQLTGAVYSIALVLVCSSLPGILVAPVIGVYIDRLNRRLVAAAMDIFRTLVLLAVSFLWWRGLLEPWHLYLMAFLLALGDQAFYPAVMVLVREVIPQRLLLSANATSALALQVGTLTGATSAGVIIAVQTPIAAMMVNAGTFLVSAFCILSMRHRQVAAPRSGARGWRQFGADLQEGLTYIRRHDEIVPPYMMVLSIMSTLYTINVLLPPFARSVLRVGTQGFGVIDGMFAVGAIAGTFVLPAMAHAWGAGRARLVGMGGLATSIMFFAVTQSLWSAMLGYLLIGLTMQVRALYLTQAQEGTDLAVQGRVHTTFTTLFSLASLAVYLLMGSAGQIVSLRYLYLMQGALLGVALLATCYQAARRRPEAAPPNRTSLAAETAGALEGASHWDQAL
jgi:MFS family permease